LSLPVKTLTLPAIETAEGANSLAKSANTVTLVDWGRIAAAWTLGRYAPPSRRLDRW
jgi:hypothetical protein